MSDTSDSQAPDEIEVIAATVRAFLDTFAALDWEPFCRYFADDATVFFQLADHSQRAEGREEIERLFRSVFERARANSPNGPPYLALQPYDLSIWRIGNGASVTFHLHDSGVLCRCTLILRHGMLAGRSYTCKPRICPLLGMSVKRATAAGAAVPICSRDQGRSP